MKKIPKLLKRLLSPPEVTVSVKLKRGRFSPETLSAIQELSMRIIEVAESGYRS